MKIKQKQTTIWGNCDEKEWKKHQMALTKKSRRVLDIEQMNKVTDKIVQNVLDLSFAVIIYPLVEEEKVNYMWLEIEQNGWNYQKVSNSATSATSEPYICAQSSGEISFDLMKIVSKWKQT